MIARRIAAGAVGGTVATVIMTGWMAVADLTGPYGEQPPKRLVRKLARRTGVPARRRDPATVLATGAAHLGFGAGSGALYAVVVPRSTVGRGITFALGVWAASYAGWIPALGLLPPPHRDNPRRAVTMATGHVVYGAVLGWALARRRAPHVPVGTLDDSDSPVPVSRPQQSVWP